MMNMKWTAGGHRDGWGLMTPGTEWGYLHTLWALIKMARPMWRYGNDNWAIAIGDGLPDSPPLLLSGEPFWLSTQPVGGVGNKP